MLRLKECGKRVRSPDKAINSWMNATKRLFKITIALIVLLTIAGYFVFFGYSSIGNPHEYLQSRYSIELKDKNAFGIYKAMTDGVIHFKFSATRHEIEKIIKDNDLEFSKNNISRKIRDPFFFYPLFGEYVLFHGKQGYVNLYLYYYPKKKDAYFVQYDP